MPRGKSTSYCQTSMSHRETLMLQIRSRIAKLWCRIGDNKHRMWTQHRKRRSSFGGDITPYITPSGIEFDEAFRFETPSSILIVGPSGCDKTCFTESLFLVHLQKLFVNPAPTIHYCYGVWQDGFRDMNDAGVQFHEGIPEKDQLKWRLSKGGLLVLDDLMAEEGEDKGLLDLFTKHSHHQNIPCCTCVKICFHQGNTLRVFPGLPTTSKPSRIHEIN